MDRRGFVRNSILAGVAGVMLPADRVPACCGSDIMGGTAEAQTNERGRLKITKLKSFGVTVDPKSDRPYVFVKIETDAGVVGWG